MGIVSSRTMHIVKITLAVFLIPFALSALASDYIVIVVQHRPAEELVGAVKGMLSPAGTVIADKGNNTLVVMDEPTILKTVKELVAALDTTAKQVRLTVTFFESKGTDDVDLFVRWGYMDGGYRIGNFAGIGGSEGLYLASSIQALKEKGITTVTQDLLVLSGGSGSIMMKKSIPVRGDVLTCLYNHGVIVEGVIFREVMTGFMFSPTVLGQDVRVQITPVMSYFTDEEKGSVLIYEARTTVLIPAGKTVAITGNNTDTGKFVADILSGFTSSAIRGNFYISITPTIED